MVFALLFFGIVLLPILAMILPHLAPVRRHYLNLRKQEGVDELTTQLLFTFVVLFFDKAFIALFLVLLVTAARIIPDSIRTTWWYAGLIIVIAAGGMLPGAYYLRAWFLSYLERIQLAAEQKPPEGKINGGIDSAAAAGVLNSILGQSKDALILVDVNRNILWANYGVSLLLGYMPDELKGKKLETLLPVEYRTKHPEYIAAFVASNEKTRDMAARRPVFALTKMGATIPVSVTISKSELLAGAQLLVALVRAA